MVDNTGMSNGPSFTYNDKNQATAIGSNSYTYSVLRPSNQSDTSGTAYYTRCSCGRGLRLVRTESWKSE